MVHLLNIYVCYVAKEVKFIARDFCLEKNPVVSDPLYVLFVLLSLFLNLDITLLCKTQ